MTRLAIVGSTDLRGPKTLRAVRDVLARYRPSVVISGGAPGVDTIAEHLAKALGIKTAIERPRRKCWDGEGGFKERNRKIAETCDALVRITHPAATTYGSGFTRDCARKLGKPTEEIVITGDVPAAPRRRPYRSRPEPRTTRRI